MTDYTIHTPEMQAAIEACEKLSEPKRSKLDEALYPEGFISMGDSKQEPLIEVEEISYNPIDEHFQPYKDFNGDTIDLGDLKETTKERNETFSTNKEFEVKEWEHINNDEPWHQDPYDLWVKPVDASKTAQEALQATQTEKEGDTSSEKKEALKTPLRGGYLRKTTPIIPFIIEYYQYTLDDLEQVEMIGSTFHEVLTIAKDEINTSYTSGADTVLEITEEIDKLLQEEIPFMDNASYREILG